MYELIRASLLWVTRWPSGTASALGRGFDSRTSVKPLGLAKVAHADYLLISRTVGMRFSRLEIPSFGTEFKYVQGLIPSKA